MEEYVEHLDEICELTPYQRLYKWDNQGDVAPSFSVLGTAFATAGKQSAWYTPELFATQLQAFADADVPLIWEWTWAFPWKHWTDNAAKAAGLAPYRQTGPNPGHPDFPDNWYVQLGTHKWLDAYIAVLKARGMPEAKPWPFEQEADIDGDGYVNSGDVGAMGDEWLDSSPKHGP